MYCKTLLYKIYLHLPIYIYVRMCVQTHTHQKMSRGGEVINDLFFNFAKLYAISIYCFYNIGEDL